MVYTRFKQKNFKRKGTPMKKNIILLLPVIFILSSCLGIESRMVLKRDGSGTLTLNYKISRMIKDLELQNGGQVLPLPVSEEDFRRAAERTEGVRLSSVKQTEDEENIYIEARLEFDRVEALNGLSAAGQMEMAYNAGSGTQKFRQVISSGTGGEEVSAETLSMLEAFFAGYELAFVIETPAPIRSHSLGSLSEDEKQLTYVVTIPELFRTPQDRILEVEW
jgi:hypothetical protein